MGYPTDPVGDFHAALSAGMMVGDPHMVGDAPGSGSYAVVPKDSLLLSLEGYLPQPLRVRQNVQLDDAESFITYVKAYALTNETRVFFEREQGEFLAVFDYHASSVDPRWCMHRAKFKPQQSEEFETWMGQNRHQMEQVQFAHFLEENLPDIVEPAGATLLEMALTFEAKKDVEFASGVRLQNGQIQFKYNEIVRGTAQSGTLEVPEQFILGIPIHVNGPSYRIPVRLRWRLKDGKAIFWYEVVRPQRFVDAALKEIRDLIAKDTAIPVLAGSLPK